MLNRSAVILLCLLLASCDSGSMEQLGKTLTPTRTASLENGRMSARTTEARVLQVRFTPWGAEAHRGAGAANVPGLWLASEDGMPRSNVGSGGLVIGAINGFRLLSEDSTGAGYYSVTPDSVLDSIANWPAALGAPTTGAGKPLVHGDRMLWSAMETENASSPGNHMVPDIQIGHSLFMFDVAPLTDAVFLRYDIKNKSTRPVSGLYAGFGADLDLYPSDPADDSWCGIRADKNSAGYDLHRHLAFAYTAPYEDGGLAEECFGFVVGFAILDMHTAPGLSQPKLAHRIVREWLPPLYSEFSEIHLKTDESILLALKGRAPDGASMVDPTTGLEQAFAFAGDPVTGQGWLDVRSDLRALQSIAPFDLQPGETRSLMVVILGASGSTLAEGLSNLRASYDEVIQNRARWDY